MTIFKERSFTIPLLVIIVVSLVTFWPLKDIFFQQDEWLGLGGAISRSESGGLVRLFADMVPSSGQATRLVPLTSVVNYLVFNLFGLKMWAYGILSIILATSNAILIFFAVKKLSKSSLIATCTSLFWVTGNLASQGITWVGTVVPSQLSVTCFLIGLYFLLVYMESTRRRFRWILLSLVSIWASLSFKESGIYYVVTFSLLIWFFTDKVNNNFLFKLKTTLFLTLPVLLMLVIPQVLLFFNDHANISPAPRPSYMASPSNVIYNAFLLPARSAFHVFLPVGRIYENIYSASRVHYGEDAGLGGCAVECLVGDAFSLMTSFYIVILILLATLLMKRDQKKLILISLVSFFASFLPFVAYQNRGAVLEIRYYIFSTLWMGLIVSSVCFFLLSKIPKARIPLMLVVFVPLITFNVINLRKSMAVDIKVGEYRKQMLQTITEIKPNLHKDNIFYFFTDNTGFYEFQSGFGQTLAVWFNDTGKMPKEALMDIDFYNSYYEGLKNYPEGKYGYFMTYEKLLKAFKENPDLDTSVLHAYYWDHPKHTIKNVSSEIRSKLENDLAK